MNQSVVEMSVRRVTLADRRYLIFYEFAGGPLESEAADAQGEVTTDKPSGETDRRSSV
jgi:hypothetical protein